MGSARRLGLTVAFAFTAAWSAGAPEAQASAGRLCSELKLVCENGHTYPFCPIAVSDAGDVVTGHLVLSGRRGAHMRLVPMGVGYRYAGRGIWFDGLDSQALLYFGNRSPVSCDVVR